MDVSSTEGSGGDGSSGYRPVEPQSGRSRASNNDFASLDERAIPITPCHRHVMPSATSSTDAHLLLAPVFGTNRGTLASINSSSQTQPGLDAPLLG